MGDSVASTPDAAAQTLVARAGVALWDTAFDDARRQAEAALASMAGDGPLRAGALGARAWAAAMSGDPDAGVLVDDAVLALAGCSDEDLADHLAAAHLVAQAALSGERLEQGEAVGLRLRTLADGVGDVHQRSEIDLTIARAQLFQGRLDEAGARVDGALAGLCPLAVGTGGAAPNQIRFGLSIRAFLEAMTGDHDAARATLDEVLPMLEGAEPALIRAGSAVFAAHALITIGASADAASVILGGAGGPDLPRIPAADRPYGYEMLTTAALAGGDVELARRWAARAQDATRGLMSAAAASRAAAQVAAADGDHESAGRAARRAREASETAGGRLEAARAQLLEGLARSAGGDREPAVAELLVVHRTCVELGAGTFGNEASRHLRRLGRRVARSVDGLPMTDREAEVAALVAVGLSNAEIGEALFINTRTVESHVAHVVTKLGARSRSGVALLLRSRADDGWIRPERVAVPAVELSPRQVEVARLVSAGLSNREIAAELGRSAKTVEGHVSAVLQRLGVRSRAAVATVFVDPADGPVAQTADQ